MQVAWWGLIPFVTMLLSIAVLPLHPVTAHHWERPKVQAAVALGLGLPTALWVVLAGEHALVWHALLEYAQFVTLLLSLFVVAGGLFLAGDIRATPRNNTAFLAVGGVLASFIGTTGAAMLLIRPLLNTNSERRHKVHTMVFAIFVVANCGGLLTPLGDPPLFLGMLRGVPFTWTFSLAPEWLFVNALLLVTYYGVERRAYRDEQAADLEADEAQQTPLGLHGRANIVWLAVIVAAVAFLPSVDAHAIESGHTGVLQLVPWRELVMLGAAGASYRLGDKRTRFEDNGFTWAPIVEVAALFIGIFLTMIPALRFLRQVAPSLPLGEVTFFLFSGGLSAVLDNAPTYATFFEMASQLPGEPRVANVPELYLTAISLGSVLCGAITYIGNGPNFMVKSVAENAGVTMPSFGGYVVRALRWLVPVLAAMVLVFIADPLWCHLLGWALAAAIATRGLLSLRLPLTPAADDSTASAGAERPGRR